MSIPALEITPELAEMGMIDNALIITDWDDETRELVMELCVRTDLPLPPSQGEVLANLVRKSAEVAGKAVASVFSHWTRSGDIDLVLNIGFYSEEDGE